MTKCLSAKKFFLGVATLPLLLTLGFGEARVAASFKKDVVPFFEEYCIRCHGPEKSKGQISLHTLDGDLSSGRELERWENVLDMLESGEMPPEDEAQPNQTDRSVITDWIDRGLHDYVKKASNVSVATTTRRLTNFEYQNTMRDLLGFELQLVKDLPVDPDKPYHFNNTAKMMMIGPDQLVRYKEAARKAMASVIVDPGKPEIHRFSSKWEHGKPGKGGLSQAEIGVYHGPGVGRKTVGVKSWPKTGEFRIRVKASGNFPPGFEEVALRLVMGTDLRHDSGSGVYQEVGTVHLTNTPDQPEEFEFRGGASRTSRFSRPGQSETKSFRQALPSPPRTFSTTGN